MSSATSIDPSSDDVTRGTAARPDPAGGKSSNSSGADAGAAEPEVRDTFRPWHFFVLVSLMAATVAVVMARQARPEHLVLISLTVGAAGFAAGALYRTLLALVARDTGGSDEPMTAGMRAVLEREKMLTLRSIKELEFDRAMGKVSAADFEEMASRLRVRAMSLMKQLDAGGEAYREMIEREVQSRVAKKQPAGRARRPPGRQTAPAGPPCVCGTSNDQDAAFCKRCGAKLAGAPAS